jgi:hypothetical protein
VTFLGPVGILVTLCLASAVSRPEQLVVVAVDEQGGRLPGAMVTITRPNDRDCVCQTDSMGTARFRNIQSDVVDVTITLPGFRPQDLKKLHVQERNPTPVRVMLPIYYEQGDNFMVVEQLGATPTPTPNPPPPTPTPIPQGAVECSK